MRTFFTLLIAALTACNAAPSQADYDLTRGGRVEVFFNDPGSRLQNIWAPDAVDIMVDLIDSATATLDFAVMGFSQDEVVEAIVRAYDRGVAVRMVGDAGHLYNSGYARMYDRHIPIVTGNLSHIMHDKFMVVDGRFIFCGTANWTPTDLIHNSNNFVMIDNPLVAEDFTAEFEQMYEKDRFHMEKQPSPAGRVYEMGDGSRLSVWFLPQDNGARRVSELIDEARRRVNVSMFFLTHKAIAGRLIAAGQRGVDVRVIVDATSAKNEYSKHELLRDAGVAVKVESWGGKMHMKAASVDGSRLIVGSMNWTSAGEYNNDENLLILDSASAASEFDAAFEQMWDSIPAQWLEDRPDPESRASVGSCSDGMDNDFDDRADAADPGCSSDPPPLPDLPPHWLAHH